METLNLRWLANHGACQPACNAWRKRWGNANVPLHEVLLALADHPHGIQYGVWLHWRHKTIEDLYCREYWPAVHEAGERYWAVALTTTARQSERKRWEEVCRAELRRLAAMLAETPAEAK